MDLFELTTHVNIYLVNLDLGTRFKVQVEGNIYLIPFRDDTLCGFGLSDISKMNSNPRYSTFIFSQSTYANQQASMDK